MKADMRSLFDEPVDRRGTLSLKWDVAERIRTKTGFYLSDGKQYGRGGETFLRMNIACPRERLMDGLYRLKQRIRE